MRVRKLIYLCQLGNKSLLNCPFVHVCWYVHLYTPTFLLYAAYLCIWNELPCFITTFQSVIAEMLTRVRREKNYLLLFCFVALFEACSVADPCFWFFRAFSSIRIKFYETHYFHSFKFIFQFIRFSHNVTCQIYFNFRRAKTRENLSNWMSFSFSYQFKFNFKDIAIYGHIQSKTHTCIYCY